MTNKKASFKTLRLILGDQLNANHSWFKHKDNNTVYLIAEFRQEATYTTHHIQKICAFFSAMEQFSTALKKAGHRIVYYTLDETSAFDDMEDLLEKTITKHDVTHFEYQRPDEYRLSSQLDVFTQQLTHQQITSDMVDTEHFLLAYDDIEKHFTKNKHHKMEFFYRRMRKQFSILMDKDQPLGGQWNYDKENRKKLTKKDIDLIPAPLTFSRDVSDIINRVERHHITYMGKPEENLCWPTNRQEALALLTHFCEICLPYFGKFQDAMTSHTTFNWSLYHSRLSFAINSKILSPTQVINQAISTFQRTDSTIDIAQIEGFVRQILGWREYIRGVYWANMPEYKSYNHLGANNKLPAYFWNGKTKMNCMKHAIDQSLDYAYAHHIQRLMITGNFCLLTEIDPQQVDEWYLGVYIDAIEWVELPNTRGMSQFADGGIIATKPYASSGNYINKMSDYCKTCHYAIKEKTGEKACPFNSLYWGFMIKNREQLSKNPRMGMIYKNWDKQDSSKQQKIIEQAEYNIAHIEQL